MFVPPCVLWSCPMAHLRACQGPDNPKSCAHRPLLQQERAHHEPLLGENFSPSQLMATTLESGSPRAISAACVQLHAAKAAAQVTAGSQPQVVSRNPGAGPAAGVHLHTARSQGKRPMTLIR